MRSTTPFFESQASREFIDAIAGCVGHLVVYCGAGVSIDRTGLSWAGLVRSCFPARHSKHYQAGPIAGQLEKESTLAPEQLASSLIFTLRAVARQSSASLRDTLRDRIKRSLYGDKAEWQAGELVGELIQLAVVRSIYGRQTTILTTNYDDHLEQGYRRLREDLESDPALPIPGLLVRVVSQSTPVAEYDSVNLDDAPESSFTIEYLHGRVPKRGDVSWPIVLDENSYAATAITVGERLRRHLGEGATTVFVGSSLQDSPVIRALSDTRGQGHRIAILTKQGIPTEFDDDGGALALELATHRAAELGVQAVFADFHGQVAQLVHESWLRTAFREPDSRLPWTENYMDRLQGWWKTWVESRGTDGELPAQLRQVLTDALPIVGVSSIPQPLHRESERYRLELWIRNSPRSQDRQLVRWATSDGSGIDGLNGKQGRIEAPSYLSAVRAFVEGRPNAYDILDLESGRESTGRYTFKSFLAVPIRVDDAMVGALILASTVHLPQASMMRSTDATEKLVASLGLAGAALLKVSAP